MKDRSFKKLSIYFFFKMGNLCTSYLKFGTDGHSQGRTTCKNFSQSPWTKQKVSGRNASPPTKLIWTNSNLFKLGGQENLPLWHAHSELGFGLLVYPRNPLEVCVCVCVRILAVLNFDSNVPILNRAAKEATCVWWLEYVLKAPESIIRLTLSGVWV